jgi:hypothetical protein
VKAALTKMGSLFNCSHRLRNTGRRRVIQGKIRCEFHISVCNRSQENVPGCLVPVLAALNGFGLGMGGKFCNPYTIENKALLGCYPDLELASGLKKMGIQINVEDISVFTQNRIL